MKRFFLYTCSIFFFAIFAIGMFSIVPELAQAQVGDDFGLQPIQDTISIPAEEGGDLRVTIVRIINIFLGFLGLIAFCVILYAGYVWMTAGGNEESIATAKKLLINASIGLLIILSAFAISAFILRSLTSAINGDTAGGPGGGGGSGDPPGFNFCAEYPLQCCTAENFVIKSITPHTPEAGDTTGMNNTVVRALFSKPVAGLPGDIFKIFRITDGVSAEVNSEFTFTFGEDGSLVEAVPTSGTIPAGEYVVEVNEGVRDTSGRELTTETSCGTFSRNASFRTGESPVIDSSFTLLDPVSINGYSGDSVHAVVLGRTYPVNTILHDDHGNAYVTLRIYKEGESLNISDFYIDGPRLTLGSTQSFDFVYGVRILESRFEVGPTYVLEVIAHDIDGNTKSDTVRFRVAPPTCLNGVLDPDEVDVDEGGMCGGGEGNSCSVQTDCSYWFKCLDAQNNMCNGSQSCVCKATPYISDVQYMNGAEGNWVTILGKNFGSNPGIIRFDYDLNGNGTIDSSVNAALAQCREGGSWNDSWIIAEVPPQAEVSAQDGAVTPLEIVGGVKNDAELNGASSVSVVGDFAYVAAQQSGFLHVFNISQPNNPQLVGKVSIPGAFFVHAVGNYAYVVYGSGIRVVDVSDKTNPAIVGTLTDPQVFSNARGVTVSGNYAYVASEANSSFIIVDISNKTSPTVAGSITDTRLNAIRNVSVLGDYAYVTSYFDNSLQVIRIADKQNPTIVGGIKNDADLLHISGIVVSGRYAYVTVFDRNSVVVIDTVNPVSPVIVGSLQDNNYLSGPFAISMFGTQGFIVNRRGNSLAVVDFTNPQSPRIVGNVRNDVDLLQPFGIASVGKYAYVANFSDRSFRIVDASGVGTQLANNPAISVSDINGLSDSTHDQFGPDLGLFTYNTTQRPNLCSVTVASDRIIPLDDGTTVTVEQGSTVAPQGTLLSLEGDGFGNDQGDVFFGTADAPISSWQGELVSADVPFGVEDKVSVFVAANDGEQSNPVPFTIASLGDLFPPTITRIEPATTTKGSYITITGTRFGNDGTVYFTQNENSTCPGSGCILAGDLPLTCGDVWSDTQIIAQVPTLNEFTLGTYFVIVKRGDGVNTLSSSGNEFIGVVDGAPRPSICRIDPKRGSAPVSDSDQAITIFGENFVTDSNNVDPTVRFWYPLAQADQPSTWLYSSLGIERGGASIIRAGGQQVETTIPYDVDSGYSMSSGPIKVENEAGIISNGVTYTVLDCREDTTGKPGFQCCTEGPDQGRWKEGNHVCEGGTREAGYVWRFTTGKMPQKFVVVESCKATSMPSPSPSILWPEGKNQCVNSQLQVRFNLPVDPSTIVSEGNLRNVSILTCDGDDTSIDCETSSDDVTDQFVPDFLGLQAVAFEPRQLNQPLLPNTWYRVALSSDITSLRADTEFGSTSTSTDSLEATKPCKVENGDAAYCFDFRTGPADFTCSLVGAGLEPPVHTTRLLGIVQDTRYGLNRELDYVFNIAAVIPLQYDVFGKSNLSCTSINVKNKPWDWGPDEAIPDEIYATAARVPEAASSTGYATAWQNNSAGSTIEARIVENSETIVATSTLIIDLGNPYAKNVWPSCLEACVNAEIGIEFSQLMNVGDYTGSNLTVRKCSDENCNPAGLGPLVQLEIKSESQSQTFLRVYPQNPLEKNSWYLVDMGEGIRSIGGITGSNIRLGNSATPKQWKFKTKDSAQLCLADSVRVLPDPFTSTFIGEAKIYRAFPLGSPDSCSPQGQILNPWQFGWDWSVEKQSVAVVSDFSFSGVPKNTCTIGCTPKGSDITRGQLLYPVCGNGIKESGEDCDIAIAGEIPGKSCNFSCLRPGNTQSGNGPDQCGNGEVDTDVGEECDPAQTGAVPGFCTNICQNAGSSSEQTGDPQIPVCGSTSASDSGITFGEDCDVNDPNTRNGCSARCTNIGTSIAQEWCDGYASSPNDPRYTQVTREQVQNVCRNAVSICGNGIVEQGEECENDVNGDDTCSDQCLVQNACGTSAEQCSLGAPGCLSDCTLAGSSITYSTPSICGDGITGIGEYSDEEDSVRSCESLPDNRSAILGGNPVQVVTSVGDVDTESGTITTFKTEVAAETSKVLTSGSATTTVISPVMGDGDYYLKCGYTELANANTAPYNDCPANIGNVLGVGRNSCCTERPMRIAEYPAANAGIGAGTAPRCRNTYIEVTFTQNIPAQFLQDNIELVQSYPQGYTCSSHGGEDVTGEMNNLLSILDEAPRSIWVRIWDTVKNFFVRIIRITVFASEENQPFPSNLTWCTSNIPLEVASSYVTGPTGKIIETKVSVHPTKLLNANSYVSVLLNGGIDGIQNALGVSIKSPFTTELSDYWAFKTNDQVCKIEAVQVDPEEALYTTPNSSKDFIARAISSQDQLIVSTDEYQWQWNWAPLNDQIFDIPSVTTSQNRITSKGFKGHTDGLVQAEILADNSQAHPEGKTFSAVFSLDALFCQRPWPASGVQLSENIVSVDTLFKDPKYNFSLYYCADSGSALSSADDLPYFRSIEVITDPQDLGISSPGDLPDALRRYLMFADKTDDAVGIQIFSNPTKPDGSRQTLAEWYTARFGDASAMTKTTVGGFDALRTEVSVYVNAFNVDGDSIYNNIYLFTIDTNAGTDTRNVFDQLIDSLTFTTNLTNFGRCLKEGSQYTIRETPDEFVNISCATDFDCREQNGIPKSGTNGVCSVAKSKFMRDLVRLEQMHTTEIKTDAQAGGSELALSSGTYIPGYTNSKWPSWGKLGSIIGGAPIDPINRWVGCEGHEPNTCWNVASTTFKCPVFAQTYEYSYDNDAQSYRYHVPFEFMRPSDVSFVSQYVGFDHIDFNRSCVPETTISPIGGQCGDGNINVGEACDPPGRSVILSTGANGQACAVGSYATATCNSSCQYTYGSCVAQPQACGNGILEGSEECDAGAQNGVYGSRCTGATQSNPNAGCKIALASNGGQFCGNGKLDRNPPDTGVPLEFCEEVNGVCTFVNSNGQVVKPKIHILLDNSGSMESDNKWNNARTAVQNLHSQLSQTTDLTLSIFSGVNPLFPPTTCSSQINFASIPTNPAAPGTPTRNALAQIYANRNQIFGTDENAAKKLIIITDGEPQDALYKDRFGQIVTSCTGNNSASVVAEIEKLYDSDIQTYVVGFGSLSASLRQNLNLFAQAGGVPNPFSTTTDIFFHAENTTQLTSVFSEIVGCFEYSQFREQSCSWNCQGYGEYCGDGTTQISRGEQCDLGEQNGTGGCTSYCKFPVVASGSAICGNSSVESGEQCDDGNTANNDGCSSLCKTESSGPQCGNGPQGGEGQPPLDPGEQCDLGAQNGVVCAPGYGISCTYCSNSCTNITVDAVAFCGNGRVDSNNSSGLFAVEACDYDSSGVYSYSITSTPGGSGLSPLVYINNYKVRQVCPDKGSFACTNSCQQLDNNCVTCGKAPGLPIPQISILNPMVQPGRLPANYSLAIRSYRKNPPPIITGSIFSLGILGNQTLRATQYSNEFAPINLFSDTQGLQTNLACNGEYGLFFNKQAINPALSETAMIGDHTVLGDGFGDLFDYAVGGQGGLVKNEIVVSPAVATDTIRIVVRWKKQPSGIKFLGEFYQDKTTQPATVIGGNTFSYFKNVITTTTGGSVVTVTDANFGEMASSSNGYYVPVNGTVTAPSVWMHKILSPTSTETALQATTISANGLTSAKPLGFYVTSPNGPMNQYKDLDVWVDVYTHHPGQVPAYSIYKPTYSFSLNDAISSSYPLSRYWHVFNLTNAGISMYDLNGQSAVINGKFTLTPAGGTNGAIRRDQCEVRKNMPSTTQCPID